MYPFLQLMRLDKPIGIWLLFFPAGWAVILSVPDFWPAAILLVMMLLGAVFTRAAGCIVNDIVDRRIDIAVARTRDRPLASGAVTLPQALILLQFLLLLALLLVVRLPTTVFYLSLLALPMIFLYPFMKRFTWWPQAFLGVTFNLGALMGWAASGQPLVPGTFALYAACVFWTLGYDTIYAVQDIADDTRVGVLSSARRVGRRIRPFISLCYIAMFTFLTITGILLGLGPVYYAGVFLAALQAGSQVRKLPCLAESAGPIFRSNQWLGLILFAAMLADRYLTWT